ncbi:MAG: class I SAM-dependent methyltransferase [Deltaproteobacteria bacterium]|nr:class I SAM-dependent methyltransferase [Deltaproteobacteria bacterium]
MKNFLFGILGFWALILHGDTAVFDRWVWLRKKIARGPLRTLDAGCGSGAFTMYAAKVGNEALGISFDEGNNRIAEMRAEVLGLKSVSFVQGDLRRLDEMKNIGLFDQVICCETIEHIKDDRKLSKHLASVLKPGGRLLLTTPYRFYHPLPGDILSETEDGGHMRWGYTHEEMKEVLESAGFKVESEEYVTGLISQALIRLERVISPLNHYLAWAVVFPFRIFTVLDLLITKLTGYPHLSIAVVAKKV